MIRCGPSLPCARIMSYGLFIAADWDVLERLHKTNTWVTEQTGIQQLIGFVRMTMSPECVCVCVCVCVGDSSSPKLTGIWRWQLF